MNLLTHKNSHMKKYHIYLYTPFHKNSKFIPHLLEHVLLQRPEEGISWFLEDNEIIWKSRAFFTEYIVTCDESELSSLIARLRTKPKRECISSEYPVIRDELNRKTYHAILYEKIWKKLISEKFNNNNIVKLNFKDIYWYHEEYYINWDIIVLERDMKAMDSKVDSELNYKDVIKISLQWIKERVYIWDISLLQFFHSLYLSEFYNSYLYYHYRVNLKKYSWDTTTFYFYDSFVCLSVPSELESILKDISPDFTLKWKAYMKKKLKKNVNDFFNSMNWAMMAKYWYTLSIKSKMELIDLVSGH